MADVETELERLYQLLYLLPVGVVAFEGSGAVAAMNPLAVQLLNPFIAPTAMNNAFTLLAPLLDDLAERAVACCSGEVIVVRHRSTLAADQRPPVTIELSVHCTSPSQFVAIMTDVTELLRQEQELRRERDRIRIIVEMVHDYGIYTIDRNGTIDSWNASGQRLFGLTESEAVGRSLAATGITSDAEIGELLDGAVFAGWRRVEGWSKGADGMPFFAETMISTLLTDGGLPESFAVITRDATEARRREDQLRLEADTDPLTKLSNRRGFASRAERLIKACEASGAPAVVLMFDIDHFKRVNDTYGHDGGDVVLRAVGETLLGSLRKLDLLGRLGGEEFAALLAGANLAAATRAAEWLRAAVQALVIEVSPGVMAQVTVSVGVALLQTNLTDALTRADRRLYLAKEQGRNRVVADEGAG